MYIQFIFYTAFLLPLLIGVVLVMAIVKSFTDVKSSLRGLVIAGVLGLMAALFYFIFFDELKGIFGLIAVNPKS